MIYIREYNNYKDIESICKKYDITDYIINNDGSIDVNSGVYLADMSLDKLPLKFNRVGGDFYCNDNDLTSLEGAPKEVVGFYCSCNKLTSLEGAPQEVSGNFSCDRNKITSLQGAPKIVDFGFTCHRNLLISLKGSPDKVGGNFGCSYNKLTSLKGGPKIVGGNFDCGYNKLTSLQGAPKSLGKFFRWQPNQLLKLISDNAKYIKEIIKWQDDYSIWRNDGTLDEFRFKDMMIDIKNDK